MGGGSLLAILFLSSAGPPVDAAAGTDPDTSERVIILKPLSQSPLRRTAFDLASAAELGKGWGRVTSTFRTAQHNRAVGGVPNSFHLQGRAIDIARRSGVKHAHIESAYRKAGYQLVESLDEGDHSHFAFGAVPKAAIAPAREETATPTRWRIVYAPGR